MKLENNVADHCDVPGMTVQQAISFRRTLGTKFLGNNQEWLQGNRKNNNTPVCLEAAPQKPLKTHVSILDLKSIQNCQEDKGCFPLCQRFRKFRLEFKWKDPFRFLLTGIFGITSGGGPHISVRIFRPKFAVPFLTNRFFALIREFGRRI